MTRRALGQREPGHRVLLGVCAALSLQMSVSSCSTDSYSAQVADVDTLRHVTLDGAILMTLPIRGPARETTGVFLLDTGAGYLALDDAFARAIGHRSRSIGDATMRLLTEPLPRLQLGRFSKDLVEPVLTLDLTDVRSATDREVVGLLGADLFRDDALVLDDAKGELLLVRGGDDTAGSDPLARSRARLAHVLDPDARPMRYERIGDGKIAVRVSVEGVRDTLHMILDSGATKTVFFERALASAGHPERAWKAVKGLRSPTLYGETSLQLVRVPRLSLVGPDSPVEVEGMDAGIIQGGLAEALNRALERDIAGLIGFSFTRRFRLVIDLRERVLWWTPQHVGGDQREFEHSSVGVQLVRDEPGLRITSVAAGSPAAHAGLRPGDRLLAIDGAPVQGLALEEAGVKLEGRPGTRVRLTLSRGTRTFERVLTRVRLL